MPDLAEWHAVLVPFAVQLAAFAALLGLLWQRRRGVVPLFEIGLVYTSLVTVYGTYPLVRFILIGPWQIALTDSRLAAPTPTVEEIAGVAWVYASHLLAFVVTYMVARGRLALARAPIRPPGNAAFTAAVVIYLVIQGFWIFLGLFYDTSASTYQETYLVSSRLPLVLAQLMNHLNGIKYPLSLVILAWLYTRHPMSRRIIVGWILTLALLSVVRLGSRTELALLVMSAAMMYHLLVRPISFRAGALGAVTGLFLFLMFGLVRASWPLPPDASFNPMLYASEFDVLFATVIDLARASAHNTLGAVPPALYFVDLVALVPQQLVPFEKVEAATWYVSTFHPEYAAQGGGFAFGTMAEAVLTGGIASSVARGAALGLCFAGVHRFYTAHSDRFWVLVFYVWATTLSYQAFRGTTFLLLVLFVYRFLPTVIGVNLISGLIERAARYRRGTVQDRP